MKNTNHISSLIDVEFNNGLFPVREVHVKGFGDRYVATESLEHELMVNDEYVSEEAKELDEKIFFYVKDRIISFDDKRLAAHVEKNIV